MSPLKPCNSYHNREPFKSPLLDYLWNYFGCLKDSLYDFFKRRKKR